MLTVAVAEKNESSSEKVQSVSFIEFYCFFFNIHRFCFSSFLWIQVGASAEGHRGFGFVDFLTRADARRAFNGLVHSTHFYGRRLVLEWAKPESSLEELREKAAANLRYGSFFSSFEFCTFS